MRIVAEQVSATTVGLIAEGCSEGYGAGTNMFCCSLQSRSAAVRQSMESFKSTLAELVQQPTINVILFLSTLTSCDERQGVVKHSTTTVP